LLLLTARAFTGAQQSHIAVSERSSKALEDHANEKIRIQPSQQRHSDEEGGFMRQAVG
jgi:hypothetical protein